MLFNLLLQRGVTTLFLSALSWLEFLHVFSREDFRRLLPTAFAHLRAVERWKSPEARQAYYQFVLDAFSDLLSPFAWEEVLITEEVRAGAVQLMGTYNLA